MRANRLPSGFSVAMALLVALISPSCTLQAVEPETTMHDATAVAGDNAFGLDLYSQLGRTLAGNSFFSPYSIRTALAMTYAGAKANTAAQMRSVLHLGAIPSAPLHAAFASLIKSLNAGGKTYDLTVANALWGQKGFEFQPAFQELLKNNYEAELREEDFVRAAEDARLEINKWVEDKTRDKIKDLLAKGTVNHATRLVLTNAIYFKAAWSDPFRKEMTHDQAFHLDPSHDVQTPMMHHGKQTLYYLANDQFQLVVLPYEKSELSMVLIVPKAIDGLPAVEKTITDENVKQWLGATQYQSVIVSMPKFKMTCDFGLGETLQAMGMTDAFDAQRADFSGMVTAEQARTEPLYISKVVHKAFVSVDEAGTEAAAATAVIMMAGSAMIQAPPPITVTADRPFIFLIRHRDSGSILFMGRLVDPRN